MGLMNFSIISQWFGRTEEECSSKNNGDAASLEKVPPLSDSLPKRNQGSGERRPEPKRSALPTTPLQASLPSTWYTSEKFFELETRAIFSQVIISLGIVTANFQAWHLLTHTSRFQAVGTYYRYNVSTYPIFLILSKDGTIRGFHNVCRHRGYPVVLKDSGCAVALGCRYHGWCYNDKGELSKVILSCLR
jgi:nitrite reductase/ring-hydroxylating ferredoxin subunit